MAQGELLNHTEVELRWAVKIPMRDGVQLNATVYLPSKQVSAAPAVLTMTPYVGQMFHDIGMFFAAHGLPFVTVDVRGRGNSEGEFTPFIQEAADGFDTIEWLARQGYCDGQVAMWGGSYGGYAQWAAAKELPPHLATMAPAASVHPGVDFPLGGNIFRSYLARWLNFVSGRALQDKIFADRAFWGGLFRDWLRSGKPFRTLARHAATGASMFQTWLSHPEQDEYWDSHNPSARQYSKLAIPVLTITGAYDADQPGALAYYRNHIDHHPSATHFLVIGPWDHPGTRTPKAQFAGLTVGSGSVIDLPQLHLEWYRWTLQGGPRPAFLKKRVAYYVLGAEEWRYSDTLEAITERITPFHLSSTENPVDVFKSGVLDPGTPRTDGVGSYVYDPRDVELAQLESEIDHTDMTDQRMVLAASGKHLVYHSAPFEEEVDLSGFFRLRAWLAIDQPDTDFRVRIYAIALDGTSVQLTYDFMRARYRNCLRKAQLITTTDPLPYDFNGFLFVSRRMRVGERLRLVIGPLNSIHWQKNHNSGGNVCDESIADARVVTVRLFHGERYPSALYVPFGVRS